MRKTDVTVLARLRLLPEFVEQGMRDLLVFARSVRKHEAACSSIEIVQDIDDPTQITMIERWSDRDAYEGAHLQTDHMKQFIERSSRYFDGPASISFCQGVVVGRDNDAAKAPYGR
jgi:quinol monooxygenase YgiN